VAIGFHYACEKTEKYILDQKKGQGTLRIDLPDGCVYVGANEYGRQSCIALAEYDACQDLWLTYKVV
jgi:hypothetical protein